VSHVCDTPKYTSSSDEDSNDDVDYSDLFKGLHRSKVDKINELIDALNEKDRLLEKQEDLLYEEHDKCVEVEKSLALAMKKNELICSELSSCHASISRLERTNVDLNARIEKLNVASSSLEHVSICNRCKDVDIDAFIDHASTILKLNDDIAKLHAQLKICKDVCEKIKFARDDYTIGRHPSIKNGLGFHVGTKDIKSHKPPNFIKEKGKASMASSSHSSHDRKNHAYLYTHVKNVSNNVRNVHHDNHAYLYTHVKNVSNNVRNVHHDACCDHAMPDVHLDAIYFAYAMTASSSSSHAHGRSRHRTHVVSHAPKDRNASYGPSMLFRTFYASYVLYYKNDRVVASHMGPKCKKGKTCI
jgi:hypothetical protein